MGRTNPLAKAINENSYEEVNKLLKQGYQLGIQDLYDAFVHAWRGNNTIEPKIVDLLDNYAALPANVSSATIKLILFLEGNNKIQYEDFNKPNLNLSGCPGLQSPIEISVRRGLVNNVKYFIEAGIQERPLTYLFGQIHVSHFLGLSASNIHLRKEEIAKKFSGKLENQCVIAELLIKNPTNDLYAEIKKLESDIPHRLLPFFFWVAKNNRTDLFNHASFKTLIINHPVAAKESLKIAVAFGAIDYVKNALDKTSISSAIDIAAALGDKEMLAYIISTLPSFGLTLKNFLAMPLLSAIRYERTEAVEYLLESGINPNNATYTSRSCLHHAIETGNMDIVKILLNRGAELECKETGLSQTPLHWALRLKKWEMAFMLVKDHNANIYAADYQGIRILDTIEDEEIKNKILVLSKAHAPSNEKESQSVSSNHLSNFGILSLKCKTPIQKSYQHGLKIPASQPSLEALDQSPDFLM